MCYAERKDKFPRLLEGTELTVNYFESKLFDGTKKHGYD